jgi:hypothetical protein
MTTQLTQATGYKVSNMKFGEPIEGSVPDSTPKIEFTRISINTQYEDGTTGPLILRTGKLFSYGVQENLDPKTKEVNGYVVPLCMYNKDCPTPEEKAWVETFNSIIEHAKSHLVEVKDQIGLWDLTMTDLKKLNPLYWKREKDKSSSNYGKLIEGAGPTLYTKVIDSKKTGTILTLFFDKDDNPINALDLLGKYMHTETAVKIESIFVGAKTTMQIKLYEASECEISQRSMSRLMKRPKANSEVRASKLANPMKSDDKGSDDDDGDGDDIVVSDDDDKAPVKKVSKKKVLRKVKTVTKKS